MSLNTYEFASNLAKEKEIPVKHVDLILTEMTNVMNETILSGENQLSKIMNFAKKRQGLSDLTAAVVERTELPEEEVASIINYMCQKLKASLKSGGVKNMMNIIKSIKNQAKMEEKIAEDNKNETEGE